MNTDGVNTTASSDDDTFAAALGLTPSAEDHKRRRRKDTTAGRPLVTAETASQAALATSSASAAQANGATSNLGTALRQAAHGEQVRTTGGVPVLTPTAAAASTGSLPLANTTGSIPAVGLAAAPEEPVSWWKRRRMRVRRVRRTIRHIDPWSVFKISLILFTCLYIAFMAAGVLLWRAAEESGVVERFESFLTEVGVFETFEIQGDTLFRSASIIGIVMVAAASAIMVVIAILFNLISDLTGGVRVTVLEEDLGRPERRRR